MVPPPIPPSGQPEAHAQVLQRVAQGDVVGVERLPLLGELVRQADAPAERRHLVAHGRALVGRHQLPGVFWDAVVGVVRFGAVLGALAVRAVARAHVPGAPAARVLRVWGIPLFRPRGPRVTLCVPDPSDLGGSGPQVLLHGLWSPRLAL